MDAQGREEIPPSRSDGGVGWTSAPADNKSNNEQNATEEEGETRKLASKLRHKNYAV